jgi:hypothetical protein
VHFQIPSDPNHLRLPSTALVVNSKGAQVAILDANSKVVLKSVQLGRDFGDSVEILAGLTASDRVVNNPPETLANGDLVQIAAAPASS